MIKERSPFAGTVPPSNTAPPELSVVMPCYNECDGIESVIREWATSLMEDVGSFEFIIVNDGSTDGTGRLLDRLRREIKSLRIIHQLNGGHSQAIRRGYEVARGRYILQVDSNGRYEPGDFLRMWEKRGSFQLVLAHRTHRLDSFPRRFFARLLRGSTRWIFVCRLRDPNVPFRLYLRETMVGYLTKIPTTFASLNLCLSMLMAHDHPEGVTEIPVPFRLRPRGKVALGVTSLGLLSLQVMMELVRLRFSMINIRIHSASSATAPR